MTTCLVLYRQVTTTCQVVGWQVVLFFLDKLSCSFLTSCLVHSWQVVFRGKDNFTCRMTSCLVLSWQVVGWQFVLFFLDKLSCSLLVGWQVVLFFLDKLSCSFHFLEVLFSTCRILRNRVQAHNPACLLLYLSDSPQGTRLCWEFSPTVIPQTEVGCKKASGIEGCSVLQCVALCCSVMQCKWKVGCKKASGIEACSVLQCVAG